MLLLGRNRILQYASVGSKFRIIRCYGVRSGRIITNPESADRFVRWLNPEERRVLRDSLIRNETGERLTGLSVATATWLQQGSTKDAEESFTRPTMNQLRLVAFANSMPFVGFGFLDNAIMIMAGEYIDATLGVTFGISTMAAAALGNMISDLFGLGLAGYVEVLVSKLGYDAPRLTIEQMSFWQTRYAIYFGRGIGVIIGCIIGMFPLLFIVNDDDNKNKNDTILSASDI